MFTRVLNILILISTKASLQGLSFFVSFLNDFFPHLFEF